MVAMGGFAQRGRTFLMANFSALSSPLRWSQRAATGGAHGYFALAAEGGEDIWGGLNDAGLALLSTSVSSARWAAVLAQCASVGEAMEGIEQYAREQPLLLAEPLLLGDGECIGCVKLDGGQLQNWVEREGIWTPSDAEPVGQRVRQFAEELYAWLPTLDNEDVIERCRAVLRQEPLYGADTRASCIIDVEDMRVDYAVEKARWQTHWPRGD